MLARRSGYGPVMSDYSEHGALPVDDAAVEEPPTEAEVRAAQERNYPEQAATAWHGSVSDGEPAQEREPLSTEPNTQESDPTDLR